MPAFSLLSVFQSREGVNESRKVAGVSVLRLADGMGDAFVIPQDSLWSDG